MNDPELFVLIDDEEKPISFGVAFELAKIEADAYMQFYGNRREAKEAVDRNSIQLERDGFPSWFTNAYRVGAHNCIDRIMVTE